MGVQYRNYYAAVSRMVALVTPRTRVVLDAFEADQVCGMSCRILVADIERLLLDCDLIRAAAYVRRV